MQVKIDVQEVTVDFVYLHGPSKYFMFPQYAADFFFIAVDLKKHALVKATPLFKNKLTVVCLCIRSMHALILHM